MSIVRKSRRNIINISIYAIDNSFVVLWEYNLKTKYV